MQSNFPGENMTIGGQPRERRGARGRRVVDACSLLPAYQTVAQRLASLKNFQMQMLGVYHKVVLDGAQSDSAGSNLAHGMDVSVLAACVDIRLLVERNPTKVKGVHSRY
jgi:hypothetical protein